MSPRILSKCDDEDDELNELVCWLLSSCCCCLSSSCCASDDDDDDGEEDGWPIVVHCLPPPTEPKSDVELEPIVDGTVETPPLLLTCKYDDGVVDEDELAAEAK